MKLIIAGTRSLRPKVDFILNALDLFGLPDTTSIDEIVSGGANGVDGQGELFASEMKLKLTRMLADWDTYGLRAGPIRNSKMAVYGDALLLIWDGSSRGSADMKKKMQDLNKPVYEVIIRG